MYRNIYCPVQHKLSGSYYTTPARCVRTCKKFPCEAFTPEQLAEYISQGHLVKSFAGFKIRREKMYLFKKNDGSIVEAPESFDQQNPGWEILQDVEEVLVVSKILVPQIKLVPKPSQPAPKKKDSKSTKSK
ncbi:MAG: hypothetical protein D5R98_08625 [Desulfonatronovibrio sp. MSAO_Bac4]|nr:MAG: hypothetical protein D5R98_08625 [Desulfonatronovibrio sp. MSAO_Bac4]